MPSSSFLLQPLGGRAQRERRGCLPGFEEGREEEGECFGNDPHTLPFPPPQPFLRFSVSSSFAKDLPIRGALWV